MGEHLSFCTFQNVTQDTHHCGNHQPGPAQRGLSGTFPGQWPGPWGGSAPSPHSMFIRSPAHPPGARLPAGLCLSPRRTVVRSRTVSGTRQASRWLGGWLDGWKGRWMEEGRAKVTGNRRTASEMGFLTPIGTESRRCASRSAGCRGTGVLLVPGEHGPQGIWPRVGRAAGGELSYEVIYYVKLYVHDLI